MPVQKRNIWAVLATLTVLLSVILSLTTMDQSRSAVISNDLRELNTGWYRLENDEAIPVTVPGMLSLGAGKDLVLYNDSLTDADIGMTLTTRAALYRPQMYLGEQLIYSYDDSAFPRNDQMRSKLNCNALLSSQDDSRTLSLVYQRPESGQFHLNPVYIGSSAAVLRLQTLPELPTVLIVFTMALFSVVAIGAGFYMKRLGMETRQFVYVAIFLLLCGAWCTLDSSLLQQLSNMSPVVCYLSFYAFMLMAVPLLQFVRNTGNMKHYRSLGLFVFLFYINIIVQSVLDARNILSFIDMLPITHLLLFTGTALIIFLLFREYRATRSDEIKMILQALAPLLGSGVLSLALYWAFKFPHYGFIFECGILIFIAYLLCSLIATMVGNLRFKTEALIYKRLSQEDQLTGLSNRRSFDNYLADLEAGLSTAGDLALIFLDLNGLKRTNDTLGHSAGDELIISAARCIEMAFSEQGICYRIGGDEFAVILPDPDEGENAWSAKLAQCIQFCNRTSPAPLSIAWGASYLKASERSARAISDWKLAADRAMYCCKEQQKAQQ